MNIDQLNEGKELLALIEKTENALETIKEYKPQGESNSKYYDGMFWFVISKHNDRSGNQVNLNRAYGNKRLVDVIVKELEDQLKEFKDKFEQL